MADISVIGRGRLHGERSTWWPTVKDDGAKAARIFCPACGFGLAIGDIDATGVVRREITCGSCGHVAQYILSGWGRR